MLYIFKIFEQWFFLTCTNIGDFWRTSVTQFHSLSFTYMISCSLWYIFMHFKMVPRFGSGSVKLYNKAGWQSIVRFDHRFHARNGNGRTHKQASIHCFLISIRIRDSASSALKHKTIQMGIQEFIKTYWLSDWKKI